jgi:hypothetical protein
VRADRTFWRRAVLWMVFAFFVLSLIMLALPQVPASLKEFAKSLAEATGIVLFVAIAVEPVLRARFLEETRGDILWGLFNPDAPEDYRAALQHLASTKHYHYIHRWNLTFRWHDQQSGVLQVDRTSRWEGISYDKDGYTPRTIQWVKSSLDPYKTEVLEWSLTVPGNDAWRRDNSFSTEELKTNQYVESNDDGSVCVFEERIANSRRVPGAVSYTAVLKSRVYEPASGETELITRSPTLRTRVTIAGPALKDLDVWMRHIIVRPGYMEGLPLERLMIKSGEAQEIKLSLPGQMLIIAWRNHGSAEETQMTAEK